MSAVTQVAARPQKPIMIFDGDCNFCRRWIARWKDATGDSVDYVPFQDASVAEKFPELARADFEQAVHLVESNGQVSSGAAAVFRSLAYNGRKRWPLWIYNHVSGMKAFTEWAYRCVATHRTLFSALSTFFWGKNVERPAYRWVRWLFLRLLGVIYLAAFLSLWTQISGLIGSKGILPTEQFMSLLDQHFDQQQAGVFQRYMAVPTLCWFSGSDGFLHWQCAAGVILSLSLLCGLAPMPCLILLWLLYLSLTMVGRIFLGYQWDALLLETGFLAVFFAPASLWPRSPNRQAEPSLAILWLLRWLLFRLMFASGCVKLLSGDPTWRNLTALNFHYETQPLPTWMGWFAHQLPAWFQKSSVVLMFGVELLAPFFIFLPRRLRQIACGAFIGLEVLIALTGNYCFFNLLSVALCVVLLDDSALARVCPKKWRKRYSNFGRGAFAVRTTERTHAAAFEVMRRILIAAVTVLILILSSVQMASTLGVRVPWPTPIEKVHQYAEPFYTVNRYGLFAVMTTSRPEIVIEGSDDGQTWLAYEFKYKAGDPKRRPRFVAPHQPRLDWQMWFEALRTPGGGPPSRWFIAFCQRLLEGSPEALSLMRENPFPQRPPKYIRAIVYDYHFTNWKALWTQGIWWRREFQGTYVPGLALKEGERKRP